MQRSQPFELDWPAYWLRFQEAHGGDPVPYEGRLLFADGWTYSATDHAGPEWPPPDDSAQLEKLKRVYWQQRSKVVEAERAELTEALVQLKAAQAGRSVPLQVVQRWWDQEAGQRRVAHRDLDLTELEERLEWLEQDLMRCRERLGALEPA